ncbi:hypothetical protein ABZ137_13895 [Streptomyces bobili]
MTTLTITTDRTTARRTPSTDRAAILTLAITGCTLAYDAFKGGK